MNNENRRSGFFLKELLLAPIRFVRKGLMGLTRRNSDTYVGIVNTHPEPGQRLISKGENTEKEPTFSNIPSQES